MPSGRRAAMIAVLISTITFGLNYAEAQYQPEHTMDIDFDVVDSTSMLEPLEIPVENPPPTPEPWETPVVKLTPTPEPIGECVEEMEENGENPLSYSELEALESGFVFDSPAGVDEYFIAFKEEEPPPLPTPTEIHDTRPHEYCKAGQERIDPYFGGNFTYRNFCVSRKNCPAKAPGAKDPTFLQCIVNDIESRKHEAIRKCASVGAEPAYDPKGFELWQPGGAQPCRHRGFECRDNRRLPYTGTSFTGSLDYVCCRRPVSFGWCDFLTDPHGEYAWVLRELLEWLVEELAHGTDFDENPCLTTADSYLYHDLGVGDKIVEEIMETCSDPDNPAYVNRQDLLILAGLKECPKEELPPPGFLSEEITME